MYSCNSWEERYSVQTVLLPEKKLMILQKNSMNYLINIEKPLNTIQK